MQPRPLPETVSDVIPEMPSELKALLEPASLDSLKLLTQCLCCACGFNPNFTFGCSAKRYCVFCVHNESACNCFKLVEQQPYCTGADACFCLKCCAFYNLASCCGFPFPCDREFHALFCNWEKQKTVCGGGSMGQAICCSHSGQFRCLEKVEKPCFEMSKCFCLECRYACIPFVCNEPDVPVAITIFGAKLWSK